MKWELELEGYNEMPYKDKAIEDVLKRNLGGIWRVKRIPFEKIVYPLNEQVDDICKEIMDRIR